MKNKIITLLCLSFIFILTACDSSSTTKQSGRYEEILKCEGRYVQRDEESEDTYGLTFSFYEKDNNVYANIDYSNFMGSIRDGIVEDSGNSDYLYEIHTIGDLYDTEQDFTILFDEEKLYVTWGSGGSEYTLTKSDGSPEDEEDQKTPFDKTELYQTITDTIDETYSSLDHQYSYDPDTKIFAIYFEAPADLRSKMSTNYDDLIDNWNEVVDSTAEMASKIYDVTQTGYTYKDVYEFDLYWVDKLNDKNEYSDSEIVLLIKNGKVIYNFMEDSTTSYSENSNVSSSGSDYYSGYSGSSSGSNSSNQSATAGERNALESAKSYLDYTSFSYSGLVDQLEYEGYSTSEAEYAADNCGADWYEQAAKKAQEYLDYSSFSRDELIDQLEYEGFTSDQASYGVNQVYH